MCLVSSRHSLDAENDSHKIRQNSNLGAGNQEDFILPDRHPSLFNMKESATDN